MLETRTATAADADTITRHRHRMFVDAGRADTQTLNVMDEHFKPWLLSMLQSEKYLGWIASENGKVMASAGLLLLDWPPHPLDPTSGQRGYLLNVYVEPEHRRKHIASHLIEKALSEARHRKIRVVSLHSTDAGRPLYRSTGFRDTNEMFFVEPVEG